MPHVHGKSYSPFIVLMGKHMSVFRLLYSGCRPTAHNQKRILQLFCQWHSFELFFLKEEDNSAAPFCSAVAPSLLSKYSGVGCVVLMTTPW